MRRPKHPHNPPLLGNYGCLCCINNRPLPCFFHRKGIDEQKQIKISLSVLIVGKLVLRRGGTPSEAYWLISETSCFYVHTSQPLQLNVGFSLFLSEEWLFREASILSLLLCDERRTSTFVVSYSPECMSEAAEAPSHRTVTYNSIVQTESECFDGQSEVPPAKSQLKVRAYVASHVL